MSIQQILASLGSSGGFAGTTFYVDTDAAGGGDGSIGSPWNHMRSSLGTTVNTALLTGPVRVMCVGVTADNQQCTQTHWDNITNTTPTNYLEFIGNNTTGIPSSTTFRIAPADNTSAIYNNKPGHVRLQYIWVYVNSTSSSGATITGFRGLTNNVGAGLTNCLWIFHSCAAVISQSGSDNVQGWQDDHTDVTDNGNKVYRLNCLVYATAKGTGNNVYGFNTDDSAWADTNVLNENCTVVDCDFGFIDGQTVINCLATGSAFSDFEGSVGTGGGASNYNASSDGTATMGANSRINKTFTFVNAAARNYQLANTDAGARGFGVNDPSSGLYLDDITGTTRQTSPTAWDIGAWKAQP